MHNSSKLSNNALAVMALASEYCRAMESAAENLPSEFVDKMVHLLPRIYMAVTDLPEAEADEADYVFGATHLEEDYYNRVCQSVATLLGVNDSYLETFHEDMKYSDTPIGATISEGLADLYQVLFNFTEDVRSADVDDIDSHLATLRADFTEYWSQTLCNVMRPLNELATGHSAEPLDDDNNSINDEINFV